jgi:hypothetical protein
LNAPRFHGFWDLTDEFSLQQSVFERRILHLNIIGKTEAAAEGTRGDAPI